MDLKLIKYSIGHYEFGLRLGLFVVFFWFGILKVINISPATFLVYELFANMFPSLLGLFPVFLILFGLFEMLIGVLFLLPKLNRLAIALLFLHIFTTILPLFFLPSATWQSAFVPTLEGQYIIKNLLTVAAAMTIIATTKPLAKKR